MQVGADAHVQPRSGDEEEAALWCAVETAGSSEARQALFSRYAKFARNIARRHHREQAQGDIELVDLYQLAYAGLLEALDRFDPQQNVPFRAFAAARISGSVLDGIAHMSEIREQISWRRRVRRERLQSLEGIDAKARTASSPVETLAELAAGLALGFMLEGTGLFSGDDEQSPPSPGNAYESAAWNQIVSRLHAEVERLPERERTILRRHYVDALDFEQLATLLGLSKGRVSQLHRAALFLLRKRMREQGHFRLTR